jgi:hypothetical protein
VDQGQDRQSEGADVTSDRELLERAAKAAGRSTPGSSEAFPLTSAKFDNHRDAIDAAIKATETVSAKAKGE